MPRLLAPALIVLIASLTASLGCIESPTSDPANPVGDAQIVDTGMRPDARVDFDGQVFDAQVFDASRPRDAALSIDAARPQDAGRDALCARSRTPNACADADCTWRGDACVALADCAAAESGNDCYNAQCSWAVDGCRAPDDPLRCAETDDAAACARRQCFWRRAQGEERVGCQPDRAPSLQTCAQPDAGTCEAAGCEWTGLGCAPPNQTPCDQLDDEACGARTECLIAADGCVVNPAAECDGLAMDDCSARSDCGVQSLVCVALPQDPCPEVPRWVCEQRPDCAAVRPDCDDAPKGGNQGGGEGGAGGGGEPWCDGPADCSDGQGCVDGECLPCDAYIGCMDL